LEDFKESESIKRTKRNNKTAEEIFKAAINEFGNIVVGLMGFAGKLVGTLGWPGTVFILGYIWFWKFGTLDQKQELINKIFLGKGTEELFWIIVISVLAAIVCWVQSFIYHRKIKVMQEEIDRLSKWKTDHQEKTIGKNLHHSQTKK